ncbi:uncharacterized protein LOC121646177 isoform X2 [Melanotaenia boesemani]|uniref:uncharacterized protein LOC121646177 isoform X2 n=1 Tax=Melanotaenia boesemani TaxID=1250792 RepID=UPI001C05542B|nr:uncharacterized protein LOC121646177 isoform X2 [Melanotaenia boesemani]
MEVRKLVLVLVLACFRLSEAHFSSVRVPPPYWAAKMQLPAAVEAKPAMQPERERASRVAQQTASFRSKWIQPAGEPLTWKFPEDPLAPVKELPFHFQVQQPVVPNRVAVRCGESRVQVEVSQDLLGLGTLINPDEITLGGCPAKEVDPSAHVLIFESELHDCGSTLEIREKGFVYAFKLFYKPKMLGKSPIIRSQSADIRVECHYAN